jgi:hypothetical protein
MAVLADDLRLDLDDAVVRLVRVALTTSPGSTVRGPVGTEVVERAADLGVLELVLAAAEQVGLTEEAATVAAATVRARGLRGAQQETMTWRVHHLLGEAGVPSLALKGVALAAMTGRPAASRTGVDVDVLVHARDWPRAHDALVAAGYALDRRMPAPRGNDSLTRFVTFSANEAAYGGPGGPIDVHWRLGPGHLASLGPSALFPRAVEVEVAGSAVPTLDPDAMLAHVALHGAKDRWTSLRSLVDAHLLVTVAGATWEAADALTGRSTVVRDAHVAVDVAIGGAGDGRTRPSISAPAKRAHTSYLAQRVALAPSPRSAAAVTAKLVLPPQVLARSSLPRSLWWMAVGPRIARAAQWTARQSDDPRPERAKSPTRYVDYAATFAGDLVRWYHGAPSSASTYRIARRAHVRTAGASSAALFGAMRVIPGAADHVDATDVRPAADRNAAALAQLRDAGIVVVDPVLDDDAVTRLRAFAEHAPARVRLADGRVVNGTYADRPDDATSVSIPGTFAWACAEVQRAMASAPLLDLALAQFAHAPVVHTPTLYWTCRPATPTDARTDALLARNFHMDFDGVQALRVHLYLTDVDDDHAPMQYVRASHRVGALRGREMHAADDALDEDAVIARFGAAAVTTVTGPAGTTFVTDPRGLHRGTAPVAGDRLFLVMPIQAGAFAGYVRRVRTLPVRDAAFGGLVDEPQGPLRLFARADDGGGVARLAE